MRKTCSVILLGIMLVLGGCAKKSTGELNIEGKYRVAAAPLAGVRYVQIHSDKTISVLYQDTGFLSNSSLTAPYTTDGDLILAKVPDNSYQHYRLLQRGDSLILAADESNVYQKASVFLIKDGSAPDVSEWVTHLSFTKVMNATAAGGIGFRDGKIITAYGASGIAIVNPLSRMIESTVTTAVSMSALEAGTTTYIASDYNVLKNINLSGGTIGSSVNGPLAASIDALAYSSNKIYCVSSSSTYYMYAYNIATNAFETPVKISEYLYDIAYQNGKIYGVAYNYIYRIDPLTFKVEKTYDIPGYRFKGIAATGTDFYVSIQNNDESIYAKVSL
ncbi:MAG: hypothetical protein U0T73_14075 [Chitinophagales bacterium]